MIWVGGGMLNDGAPTSGRIIIMHAVGTICRAWELQATLIILESPARRHSSAPSTLREGCWLGQPEA